MISWRKGFGYKTSGESGKGGVAHVKQRPQQGKTLFCSKSELPAGQGVSWLEVNLPRDERGITVRRARNEAKEADYITPRK